jgi:tetratricopeptide (TPR) repeat protein
LGSLSLLTLQQLGYWRDSETLWTRALAVTHGDVRVEKQLANAFVGMGDGDRALPHLIHIAQIDPQDTTVHVNLGACYAAQGRSQEAAQEFEKVVELTEHKNLSSDDRKFRASALLNLGFAYTGTGDYSRALANFTAADRFDPQMTDKIAEELQRSVSETPSEASYIKLALLLRAKGEVQQAVSVLQNAINNNPDSLNSRTLSDLLSR